MKRYRDMMDGTHISSLLRAALLLGALLFPVIQPKAQTTSLPDAFETMDPAAIIGDGNYYYIQFYDGNIRSYLTDCGVGVIAQSKDFQPYAYNRLWTLLPAGDGDATHFKLRNKAGHYLYFVTGSGGRVRCTDNPGTASVFKVSSLGDGYELLDVNDTNGYPMARNNNAEWTDLICNDRRGSRVSWYRFRFAKLKENSAFLIYYRGEGADNSNSAAEATRHYLTYSGTGNQVSGSGTLQNSDISSRQSIIPKEYGQLPFLPTIAAYHRDGLWTLEESGDDGGFYIKKYGGGSSDYLVNSSGNYSVLGVKDAVNAQYKADDTGVNRYTPIRKVEYEQTTLADADLTKAKGNSSVDAATYVDLSAYSKMIVNGTSGSQVNVLMNRLADSDGLPGNYVDKSVTLGSDGKAVVDLTNLEINHKFDYATVRMTHVNGSDGYLDTSYGEETEVLGGYNNGYNWSGGPGSAISEVGLGKKDWGVNNIIYLQVDASAINGTIKKVTLLADASGNDARETEWGAGYINSEWSSTLTWNTADREITDLTAVADRPTVAQNDTKQISLDITEAFINDPDKIATILVYETRPGGGNFTGVKVVVEYMSDVTDVTTGAKLNAITTTSGNVNSITLLKEGTGSRYLHYKNGDGWQVDQWTNRYADLWHAAFYPVEVVDKDEFYQVRLQTGTQMVGVSADGNAVLKPDNAFNPELWTLEQFEADYQKYRLKSWDGSYYAGLGNSLVDTAPTSGLGVFTNSDINSTFTYIEWVRAIPYEVRIRHNITHKVSNVRLYYTYNPTTKEQQELYRKQGLATDADSEWWNHGSGTQNVNEFKITHYVKKGDVVEFGMPTTLNMNNDHRLYQRWYHYNDKTCDNEKFPDGSDLEGLKNHFKLKTSDGEVMSYLYNNGIVTGEKLDWSVVYPNAQTAERRLFTYHNYDGERFTLAADVSRYSDFTYQNSASHLDGDLEEPSLTMRYIYYMRDAKEMARNLMACTGEKWLEEKTFHFPASRVAYDGQKKAEYQGEFIGIYNTFRDYWVFDTTDETLWTDDHLVSAVTSGTSGLLEFVVEDGGTGITLGGKNDKGYYLYDEGKNGTGNNYADSRFVAFKYPKGGTVNTGETNKAYLKVYFNNKGTKYQIAKFTIIFDEGTATLPWKSVNGSAQIEGTDRDPKKLVAKAGKPIAKISFDYPEGATFKNSSDYTIHNIGVMTGLWSEIPNSSPLPLTFAKTNYGFDGENPSWGSYSLVTEMPTRWGNSKTALPVDDDTYGYGSAADAGLQRAFLYIDASEQPGDICSVDFTGEFCAGGKLMCTGWISGSNKVGRESCPGSVTITVKGQIGNGDEETIYRFCPGQCYELDNGTSEVDGSGRKRNDKDEWVDDGSATHVVWQQFYFEFEIGKKYDRQWLEVNNNCVSSTGGDFMLDNVEIYNMVPEVTPEMNTPLCVDNESKASMQLLKLTVGFDKLVTASGINTADDEGGDHDFGIVFLDKKVFLQKMQEGLKEHNGLNLTLEEVEEHIKTGEYKDVSGMYKQAYEAAFNAALLGNHTAIWDSDNAGANQGQGILNFHWNHNFESNELYSFAKAVNRTHTIYRYEDTETGERMLVMNGNYPQLPWKINTDYYMLTAKEGITDINDRYRVFNICSDCSTEKVFQVKPPYRILSMESSDVTTELEVCEGKIPTVLTDLEGYDYEGHLVALTGLNFDWWLGDPKGTPQLLATLDNYHRQQTTVGAETVRLDAALSALRAYYPEVNTLEGVVKHTAASDVPRLTQAMIDYLRQLVDAGQLVLRQSSVNIPAEKTADDDPYAYFVAAPIHDGIFDQALNNRKNVVAYFCDEPQGLRLKVGDKAPSLKCGFVAGENGFPSYDYSDAGDAVLSIRLAKKAQFETVQHGTRADAPIADPAACDAEKHFLWLPIRDAQVQSTGSEQVIQKADDYNIYLASTDDPTWDKAIYTAMSQTVSSLPVVGKIVRLNAIAADKAEGTEKDNNRLCVYFTEEFEVREGYTYTLSLPFREDGDENTCDGTLLLNLKIVPDYEVWTGAAGNTDWNNDQNWRRADGNMNTTIEEPASRSPLNNNELYRTSDLPADSPLKDYRTNYQNYRTPLDRILRKGFAPLYCTHILMKNNEWGDAPQLYDALDGQGSLAASPFPNLRPTTSTPILKYDLQARLFDIWSETYGSTADKGREGDLIAEMYQLNSCDEIAFQPGAELLNAHLLNYNNAWVEYQLDMNRWYLLGSPLQGTVAGEWYAPTGTAQQKTTYYEPVNFGQGYDRYSPAIFQRSWDKAKAVLYEVGSTYDTDDDSQTTNLGSPLQGQWNGDGWNTTGADDYLDRLGYRPMGNHKANVAIRGVWSNTYNDATVDYAAGGFSVMVMNHLKGNDKSDGHAIVRLPKEDTMYDYYKYEETGAADGGTDTDLSTVQTDKDRAKNRGRLKTDLLLPTSTQKTEAADSRYGDRRTYTRVPTRVGENAPPMTLRPFTETVPAGESNLGYYLVENPFPCGLDMDEFFAGNTGLEKKYWLLTATGQHLVQRAATGEWFAQSGSAFAPAEAKVAPGQGFFVQASTAGDATGITFTKDMQAQTRYGVKADEGTAYTIVVGTKQKMKTQTQTITQEDGTEQTVEVEVPETDEAGNYVLEDITDDVAIYSYVQSTGDGKKFPLKARTRADADDDRLPGLVITASRDSLCSSALVMQRPDATNDFLPAEDTETFISTDEQRRVPTVYTLCGRLATTVNTLQRLTSLPIGVESTSEAPCTLTFSGVELLGDSIAVYDAHERTLTPIASGHRLSVSGQTLHRYYLVRGLSLDEAQRQNNLRIYGRQRQVTVVASTDEPITDIRCTDAAGRLVFAAQPQEPTFTFTLPAAGLYIVEARTASDRAAKKLLAQ